MRNGQECKGWREDSGDLKEVTAFTAACGCWGRMCRGIGKDRQDVTDSNEEFDQEGLEQSGEGTKAFGLRRAEEVSVEAYRASHHSLIS